MKWFISLLFLFVLLSSAIQAQWFKAKFQRTVDSLVLQNQFSGTLLVEKNGQTVYHRASGLANRPFSVPASLNTKYKIASITKLFTAVLIMQLVDAKKIDVNATIKKYLPNYGGAGASRVTIQHLLNHTSGMVNMDTVTSIASALKNGLHIYQHPYTSDDLLTRFCSDTLVSKPGEKFSYNNADYVVLGKIIEAIYARPFDAVLYNQILKPLNMQSSGMLNQSVITEQLADTYFYADEAQQTLVNDFPVYIQNWYAAGAMYSTTGDILKFTRAVFGGKLISRDALAQLIKPGLDDYGYGVWLGKWNFKGKEYFTVQRPGSIMGAQTKLVHFPAEKATIIILSNTANVDVNELAYQIGKMLF